MTNRASWTVRGLVGSAVRAVPATLMLFVSDIEAIWTRRYGGVDTQAADREAKRWTVMACTLYVASILALWLISRVTAVHFVRLIEKFELNAPPATHVLIATARYGWALSLLVPLIGISLFQLRKRGGVFTGYAEVAHMFIVFAFILFGAGLGLGALAFVPLVFPVS